MTTETVETNGHGTTDELARLEMAYRIIQRRDGTAERRAFQWKLLAVRPGGHHPGRRGVGPPRPQGIVARLRAGRAGERPRGGRQGGGPPRSDDV